MDLPQGLRLSFEDNPSRAEREFIDDGLGAYNAAFLRDSRYSYFGIFVRDAGGPRHDPCRADRQLLCRLAVRGAAVGRNRSAPARDRAAADGRGRAACPRFRLPFCLCRYLLVPRTRVL